MLIGRYGVSTFLIERFNLQVDHPVPYELFAQIENSAATQNQTTLNFGGQSFPISIEPFEDLYQITFLSNTDMKVA